MRNLFVVPWLTPSP